MPQTNTSTSEPVVCPECGAACCAGQEEQEPVVRRFARDRLLIMPALLESAAREAHTANQT
jgi:hypothetical protein